MFIFIRLYPAEHANRQGLGIRYLTKGAHAESAVPALIVLATVSTLCVAALVAVMARALFRAAALAAALAHSASAFAAALTVMSLIMMTLVMLLASR
jgi:hypothetical protein